MRPLRQPVAVLHQGFELLPSLRLRVMYFLEAIQAQFNKSLIERVKEYSDSLIRTMRLPINGTESIF
jgi:hypothetical protein